MNTKEMIARHLYYDGQYPEKGTVADICWTEMPVELKKYWIEKAEAILNLRYPNGKSMLAVLDEDQSLPVCLDYSGSQWHSYEQAQKDMFSKGWRKTKESE